MSNVFAKIVFFVVLISSNYAFADTILLQSTTSTRDSGLYDYILPIFTKETGISVKVVAVGTGQAIRNAANGDADVLLVHAKDAEDQFVADGNGVERFDVMYNDFVLIGPHDDPAGVKGFDDLDAALKEIFNLGAKFVSRGDDSGTHTKELKLWQDAGLTPIGNNWYLEAGSGMGATIRIAIEVGGYTLTDRATWLAYANKQDAEIVFEGVPPLFNQYGIIAVHPHKFPHVNIDAANMFIEWMLGENGQTAIASYELQGEQLFFPNAK